MKIYIFRHGITKSNEEKRYTGWQDVSLSENGIKELVEISKKVKMPKVDKVIASPLKRCIETFDILFPNQKIDEFESDLREACFGQWEGKNYIDLMNDPDYIAWIKDVSNALPPGGESFMTFNKRVKNAFEKIIANNKAENILLMCHGGVTRSIMSQVVDPSVNFFDWEIPNGLGYVVEVTSAGIKYDKYYDTID